MLHPRILWLDDSPDEIQWTLRRIERELPVHLDVVRTLGEAGRSLRMTKYQLVIVDIMLSTRELLTTENTGVALIRELRSGAYARTGTPASAKVIVASAVLDSNVQTSNGRAILMHDALRQIPGDTIRVVDKPWPSRGPHSLLSVLSEELGLTDSPAV